MRLKYVMFDEVFPVLFGVYFKHDQVRAEASNKPTSAGFCSVSADGSVSTYGKSESLGLSPNPADAALIKCALELKGVAA